MADNHTFDERVFIHQCVVQDCAAVVKYDDEPWCIEHAPPEGSHLENYSARSLLRTGLTNKQKGGNA